MSLIIDNGAWASKCGTVNHEKPITLFTCAFANTDELQAQSDIERLEQSILCASRCVQDGSLTQKLQQESYYIFQALNLHELPQFPFTQQDLAFKCIDEQFQTNSSPESVIVINDVISKYQIFELLFEQFGVQQVAVCDQKPLQLLSTGKTSGLSVNFGFKNCQISPILNGYNYSDDLCIEFPTLSGQYLEKSLRNLIQKRGYTISGNKEYDFLANFIMTSIFSDQGNQNVIHLPDGNIIELDEDLVKTLRQTLQLGFEQFGSYIDNVKDAISEDVRDEMNSLCLSGGGILSLTFKKLSEEKLMSQKCIFSAIQTPEPLYDSYNGAQIASLIAPQSWWLTKQQYLDRGAVKKENIT